MARPRKRGGERGEDKKPTKKNEAKVLKDSISDGPVFHIEIPKEVAVTAWYTVQVSMGHGLGNFTGLPGLILELNFYKTTVLCSK